MIEVAKEAAFAGAAVLKRHFGNVQVQTKDGLTQNLVTQADLESELAVTEVIQAQFPHHAILGEEDASNDVDLAAEHLWIIDPLDGTTNYAHGIPQFCTAVAYATRGIVRAGVVYDPCRDEMFHAISGQGAFLNERRISVSTRTAITEAVVATGFYYDRGEMMRNTLASIDRLFQANVRGIRRLGAAALDICWVACGRWEAFFEYQLSPWDYSASSIILGEAGGQCNDREGKELRIDSGSVIATNGSLHDPIVEAVRYRG